MQFERRKPSILVGKISSSICVSTCDASGPDPVLIAGDCGGVAGSFDPVSTAARRGDGSHSDDGLFSPTRCSPIIPSAALRFWVLDAVQKAGTLFSRSFLKMPGISLFVP